jgi:cytochrome c oxidase assembly factor CtaG/cytochrome c2
VHCDVSGPERSQWGRRGRLASLALGGLAGGVALLSQLHALAEAFLWAHMVQHLLLVLVAAPLILLGRPVLTLARWLPPAARRLVAVTASSTRVLRRVVRGPGAAVGIWVLHVGVLWAWHAPAVYDAAVRVAWLHGVEHASLFGTSLLFWSMVARRSRGLGVGAAVLYLFTGAAQCTMLGGLITLAESPVYASHASVDAGGSSLLWDQQLAGLIMWIPGGMVYLVAALAALAPSLGTPVRRRGEAPASGAACALSALPSGRTDDARPPGEPAPMREDPAAGPPPTPGSICDPGRRAVDRVRWARGVRAVIAVALVAGLTGCRSPERTSSQPAVDGDAERGRAAIQRHGCGGCHIIPGIAAARGVVGPSLARLADRPYLAGSLVNDADNLVAWIRDPRAIDPRTVMPVLGVSEGEARDIAARLYAQ